MDFADKCVGNYSMPECICKGGFDGNGVGKWTVGIIFFLLLILKRWFDVNMTLVWCHHDNWWSIHVETQNLFYSLCG